MNVDLSLLLDEVKAQRNVLCDQLALAGATIVTLQKENQELKVQIETISKERPAPRYE